MKRAYYMEIRTHSSPALAEIYREMAKAFELKAQESLVYVVSSSVYGYYTQATITEIADWSLGLNMPPMQPFGRWWLALSIKLKLPSTKIFDVDWPRAFRLQEPYIPRYFTPSPLLCCY